MYKILFYAFCFHLQTTSCQASNTSTLYCPIPLYPKYAWFYALEHKYELLKNEYLQLLPEINRPPLNVNLPNHPINTFMQQQQQQQPKHSSLVNNIPVFYNEKLNFAKTDFLQKLE